MKKNLVISLVLALSLIFTACGVANEKENNDNSSSSNETSQIEDNQASDFFIC